MDTDLINQLRKMGDHAHERAVGIHIEVQELGQAKGREKDLFQRVLLDTRYHQKLNDYFYWSGKATAYVGIAAGLELRGIVEEELEGEGSCP